MQPPSTGQQPFPTTVAQANLPFSTGQATSMPAAQASVQSPTPSALQAEDLYAYQKCTIMIVVQLHPQVEDGRPRSVLLSVQNGTTNKEDLPLYRLLTSEDELGGPFPPALVCLLEALQQELPTRKQRHEQRTTAKKAVIGRTATKAVQKSSPASAKDAGKPKKTVSPAATTPSPPPVSAPATPLPKEGLMLGGLFDDLEP
jgi:hypothetical protein